MARRLDRLGALSATLSVVLFLSAARRPNAPIVDPRADARIAELESRIAALEAAVRVASQSPSTVKAPFMVVDDAGRPIFSVDAVMRGWRVVAPSGKVGATGVATDEGGRIAVGGDASKNEVVVSALAKSAGVEIRDARESARVRLDLAATGRSELALLDAGHKPVVVIDEQADGGSMSLNDRDGTSIVTAYTSKGGGRIRARNAASSQSIVLSALTEATEVSILQGTNDEARRASLMVTSNRPELALYSDQNTKIVDLLRGETDGGKLTLADNAGKIHAVGYAGPDAGVFEAMTPSADRIALVGAQSGLAVLAVKQDPKASRGSLSLTPDGVSNLVIVNRAGNGVVALSHSPAGGGILQLSNSAGEPSVEAGTLPSGLGIVRAGPRYKCTGNAGVVGGFLAPDCIKGRAEP